MADPSSSGGIRRRLGCAGCAGCGCGLALLVICGGGVLGVGAVPVGARVAASQREVEVASEVAPGRFVEAADLDIHLLEWGPGDGPLVLMVPGTSGWAQTWTEIATPLGAGGYHVVGIDLPPFGYSERPEPPRYDRGSQAARILGVLDALDARDAVLVGHSFGGGATIEAAMSSATDQLSQLVLLAPALGLGAADSVLTPAARVPSIAEPLVAMTFTNPSFLPIGVRSMIADPTIATPARVGWYQQPLVVQGTTEAVAAWVPELLAPSPSQAGDPEAYGHLTLPTTLVWGTADVVTPIEQGRALVDLLPNVRLHELEGGGSCSADRGPQRRSSTCSARSCPSDERRAPRRLRHGGRRPRPWASPGALARAHRVVPGLAGGVPSVRRARRALAVHRSRSTRARAQHQSRWGVLHSRVCRRRVGRSRHAGHPPSPRGGDEPRRQDAAPCRRGPPRAGAGHGARVTGPVVPRIGSRPHARRHPPRTQPRRVGPDAPAAPTRRRPDRGLWALPAPWPSSTSTCASRPSSSPASWPRPSSSMATATRSTPVELAVTMLRAMPCASLMVVPAGGHVPIFGEANAPFVSAALAYLQR